MPTLAEMGVALNVVPMHAEITVDMRNLPGDTGNAPERFMQRILRAAGYPVAGVAPPSSVGDRIKTAAAELLFKVRFGVS